MRDGGSKDIMLSLDDRKCLSELLDQRLGSDRRFDIKVVIWPYRLLPLLFQKLELGGVGIAMRRRGVVWRSFVLAKLGMYSFKLLDWLGRERISDRSVRSCEEYHPYYSHLGYSSEDGIEIKRVCFLVHARFCHRGSSSRYLTRCSWELLLHCADEST